MPNKTIYIRRDDLELWDNLKDKSKVVSDLLNHLSLRGTQKEKETALAVATNNPHLTNPETAVKIIEELNLKPRSGSYCKEGHSIPEGRSKCLGKGCKYS